MLYLIFLEILFIIFCCFMIARNNWVRKVREKIINSGGMEEYYKYSSYDNMVLKFWIWDYKKFKK